MEKHLSLHKGYVLRAALEQAGVERGDKYGSFNTIAL